MEQLITFIMQHLYLWGAAAMLVILLLVFEFEASWRGIHRMSPAEVSLLMNRKGIVIDINESEDFARGYILGAVHLPFSEWSKKLASLEKDKSAHLILVSTQERQALHAAKILKQKGFENVAILAGGLPTWQQAGLPLVKR
jgi:rhodanese-related sulfurtransferase